MDKTKKEDKKKEEIYLEERIQIPFNQEDGGIFSWRKLWLFTGPGWLSKSEITSKNA